MAEQEIDQILTQFDEIDHKFSQLVEKIKVLENDNEQQKQKIAKLEKELGEKAEAENQFAEEKVQIKSKVDGLLQKIDEFIGSS